MPDQLGDDMRNVKSDEEKEEKDIEPLDEGDVALLKTYEQGQRTESIKAVEQDIKTIIKHANELTGIEESDTHPVPPALWDLAADKQTLQNEQPAQETSNNKDKSASVDKSVDLYEKYPSVRICQLIIDKGERTLQNLPADLFLMPSRLTTTETVLKTLKKLIKNGFYKEMSSNEELAIIQSRLEDLIIRLRKKMTEINIVELEDTNSQKKRFNFDACTMVAARLQMDEKEE